MSTLKICKLKLLATDPLGAFAGTRDPLKKYSKGNNSKPEGAISQFVCAIVSYCHFQ